MLTPFEVRSAEAGGGKLQAQRRNMANNPCVIIIPVNLGTTIKPAATISTHTQEFRI